MKLYLRHKMRSKNGKGQFYILIKEGGQAKEIALNDSEGNRVTDSLLARSEFARLNGLAKRGINPFTYDKTLSDWLNEFFVREDVTKASATVRSEKELLIPTIKWLESRGVLRPQQLTPAIVEDRMIFRLGSQKIISCSKSVSKTCRTSSTQRVSARTVNLERAYLSMFYAFIMTRLPFGPGSIEVNPVRAVKPRKVVKKVKRPISELNLKKLIQYFENPTRVRGKLTPANGEMVSLAIRLSVQTGLRPAELSYLLWEDIDVENEILWVRNTPEHTLKDKKDRTVPLTPTSLEILKRCNPVDKSGPIFKTTAGQPFQNAFRLSLQKACARLKIPVFHPYQLRHTFATRSLDSGSPIQQVASVLGHASLKTTQGYTHASDQGKRNAVLAAEFKDTD